MNVSIVIPAKNEEKNIKKFVTALARTFKQGEIIVVCNGCTDNTHDVVKSIRIKNVRTLNFGSIGKGGAIIEGLKVAKKSIVGFVDSDGSFDESMIKKVLKEIDGYDVAIASKWKGKKFFDVKYVFTNKLGGKLGSRVWNLLIRILFGLNISDTQAGLKFFKKSVYDSIDHDFICRGFDIDVELLSKLNDKGYTIKEVFIRPKISRKTTFRTYHVFKMFINLLKYKLTTLTK